MTSPSREAPVTDPRVARARKLAELERDGIDPYPVGWKPSDTAAGLVTAFREDGPAVSGQIAGRVVALRPHGRTTFLHLADASGRIQVYLRGDELGEEAYALLERLNNQNPHPGDDKTDNIAAAKKQKQEVDGFIGNMSAVFQPIPAIPEGTNVSSAMFAGALRKTIDKLQNEASKGGVQVPTNFYFSFTAVRDRIMFDRAGLPTLATQLGEVNAICGVLIDARVNALDAVRREKVSVHDLEAQQVADYLSEVSVTNEVAIISPYEVTFRCFSSELADVLAGYASSPHGLIVRAMNVEPVAMAGGIGPDGMAMDVEGRVAFANRAIAALLWLFATRETAGSQIG